MTVHTISTGEFGTTLRRLRRDAGLTQEALAHSTGLSVEGISALERGQRRHPRADTIDLLCGGLGLTDEQRTELVGASARRRVASPGAQGPQQLPICAPGFTGRVAELLALTERLGSPESQSSPRLVAIVGMGGLGKTTLAVHAASSLVERYPDGQLYVDLRGHDTRAPMSREGALTFLLASLGVDADDVPREIDQAAALFRSISAHSRLLIVLDNAENFRQIEPLLPSAPSCGVLLTSRRTLSGRAHIDQICLPALDHCESVAVLEHLVGVERIDTDRDAAHAIARRCGGLPLALKIVGARLAGRPSWPLDYLADRLAPLDSCLTELRSGDLTVRATIAMSVDHLESSDDRIDVRAAHLHVMLGLLPEPTVAEETVAALVGRPLAEVREALDRLTDVSLIDSPRPGRYRVHDLLHVAARENAQEHIHDDDRTEALSRVLDLYIAIAWRTREMSRPVPPAVDYDALTAPAREFGGERRCLEFIVEEIDQIIGLARMVAADPRLPGHRIARLAEGLITYFVTRPETTCWPELLSMALGATAVDDHAVIAGLRNDLGLALSGRGDHEGALTEAREAVQHARLAMCRRAEAAALGTEALVLDRLWRIPEAIETRTASLRLSEADEDDRAVASAWRDLGLLHARAGDVPTGIECERRSLEGYAAVGLDRGIAMAAVNLGVMLRDTGALDEARHLLERSVELFRQVGDCPGETEALDELGYWHVIAGDPDQGLTVLAEGLALVDESGEGQWEASIRKRLGHALQRLGRAAEAQSHWRAALRIHERRGEWRAAAETRALIAP